MDQGDRYLFRSRRRENMASNLKKGKRHGGGYYIAAGITNAMSECWNGLFQAGEKMGQTSEEYAPCRYEGKLYYRECDGFWKGIKYGFGGGVRQRGSRVPDKAKSLTDLSAWITSLFHRSKIPQVLWTMGPSVRLLVRVHSD